MDGAGEARPLCAEGDARLHARGLRDAAGAGDVDRRGGGRDRGRRGDPRLDGRRRGRVVRAGAVRARRPARLLRAALGERPPRRPRAPAEHGLLQREGPGDRAGRRGEGTLRRDGGADERRGVRAGGDARGRAAVRADVRRPQVELRAARAARLRRRDGRGDDVVAVDVARLAELEREGDARPLRERAQRVRRAGRVVLRREGRAGAVPSAAGRGPGEGVGRRAEREAQPARRVPRRSRQGRLRARRRVPEPRVRLQRRGRNGSDRKLAAAGRAPQRRGGDAGGRAAHRLRGVPGAAHGQLRDAVRRRLHLEPRGGLHARGPGRGRRLDGLGRGPRRAGREAVAPRDPEPGAAVDGLQPGRQLHDPQGRALQSRGHGRRVHARVGLEGAALRNPRLLLHGRQRGLDLGLPGQRRAAQRDRVQPDLRPRQGDHERHGRRLHAGHELRDDGPRQRGARRVVLLVRRLGALHGRGQRGHRDGAQPLLEHDGRRLPPALRRRLHHPQQRLRVEQVAGRGAHAAAGGAGHPVHAQLREQHRPRAGGPARRARSAQRGRRVGEQPLVGRFRKARTGRPRLGEVGRLRQGDRRQVRRSAVRGRRGVRLPPEAGVARVRAGLQAWDFGQAGLRK